MKKLIGLVFAGVAVFVLSGCGSSGGYYYDDETTLFLVDQDGYSLGGVPYICDSMSGWSETRPNGEFTFLDPESCTFDFNYFDGNYGNDPLVDDIIYIVDDLDRGKGGIPYDCDSFVGSTTYGDGSFDYDIDDQCIFHF